MEKRKIAVVTGASGGLGSELSRLIAARGIALILIDHNATKTQAFGNELEKIMPGCVAGVRAVDLSDSVDISRAVSQLLADFPRVDYLFNNAGVLPDTLQFSAQGVEVDFAVNALAPLQLIDGLRPALAAAGGAAVVNTSAGISLQVKSLDWDELVKPATFSKLFGPYTRSKEALNVLTAAIGAEFAADSIVVRAADPGPTKTGLTKGSGTPLWMRIFSPFLPSAATNAKKIADAALSNTWGQQTGIFISGGKLQLLPPQLADPVFQAAFLKRCRDHIAQSLSAAS